jgi:hypothetical protein
MRYVMQHRVEERQSDPVVFAPRAAHYCRRPELFQRLARGSREERWPAVSRVAGKLCYLMPQLCPWLWRKQQPTRRHELRRERRSCPAELRRPWPQGGPRRTLRWRRAFSWAPGARRSGAPWCLGPATHVGASGAHARHRSSSWQPAQRIPTLGGTPRWSCSPHSEVPPRHSHPWHTSREKTRGVSDWWKLKGIRKKDCVAGDFENELPNPYFLRDPSSVVVND